MEIIKVNGIEIWFPVHYKNIGLRISGGADSAIVGYMLCDFITKNNLECTIVPITIDQVGKNYQYYMASGILDFYSSRFPSIKIGKHYRSISEIETRDYSVKQTSLSKQLLSDGIIDCYFTGLTANPPESELKLFNIRTEGIPPDRSGIKPTISDDMRKFFPLINSDKRVVSSLYEHYGLLELLFPITRSCESYDMKKTNYMITHCGGCYHCKERHWGFGRYQ